MDNFSNLKQNELIDFFEKDELEKKIISVAEHIIETGDSYRKTAKKFGISAPTVLSYCKKYKKMYPIKANLLDEQINKNKEETIERDEVKQRVLENTKLLLNGKTIEEIAVQTNTDYWIVYRDLTVRLKMLDVDLFNQVAILLDNRRMENLKNYHK